jgi:molecular chaperone HscB
MSDPFETLGVEPRFDLDEKALAERHRALSGALHPDRYAGRPAAERRMALDKAIAVNAAWRRLRDPLQRAESLLANKGVAVGETVEPKPTPALLMEMLEVREELADASRARDLARLARLGARMHEREQRTLARLAEGFTRGDDLPALVPVLGELRYLRRFFEELSAVEEKLAEEE